MLMPVAMVIGVNEWLPWSLLFGILQRGYFDVCLRLSVRVCVRSLKLWLLDDESVNT